LLDSKWRSYSLDLYEDNPEIDPPKFVYEPEKKEEKA